MRRSSSGLLPQRMLVGAGAKARVAVVVVAVEAVGGVVAVVVCRMHATVTTRATAGTSLIVISDMSAVLVAQRGTSEAPAGAEGVPIVAPDPMVDADAELELGQPIVVEAIGAVDAQAWQGTHGMGDGSPSAAAGHTAVPRDVGLDVGAVADTCLDEMAAAEGGYFADGDDREHGGLRHERGRKSGDGHIFLAGWRLPLGVIALGMVEKFWLHQCFEFDDVRWMDAHAPFGNRALPGIFMRWTRAIVAWMQARGIPMVGNLDDFFRVLETKEQAEEAMMLLVEFVTFLGFKVNSAKCEGPAQVLEFLGVLLDTSGEVCTASIDEDCGGGAEGGGPAGAGGAGDGVSAVARVSAGAAGLLQPRGVGPLPLHEEGLQFSGSHGGQEDAPFRHGLLGHAGFGGVWERLFFMLGGPGTVAAAPVVSEEE
ncbi:hypothetical protein CYMTET_2570 [Cymbomonas tetramitiformis]|uniref:Reverse transcriptase domain-containing protein n=1 Tax=Cymbomonas tetramitiformis TaxID=36881 RepID=A0AAE0LLW3_9CHLO|nr:hypothetical protein CYMTET_2570 [Cymbomonas tetramitiformis]